MDNNNDRERKKAYHELINFAIQGMGENAQFSIAIAVGIFGILAIFATINNRDDEISQDPFLKKCFVDKINMDPDCRHSIINCLLGSSSLLDSKLCYPPFV